MPDIQIDPPEEQEQESMVGTLVLRFIVTFLCMIIGIALVLAGYAVALFLDIDRKEFSSFTSAYFIISMGIWIIIGLSTPFASISRVFEELRGMSSVRIVVFIFAFAVSVFLYWYFISFIVSLIISVFGVE